MDRKDFICDWLRGHPGADDDPVFERVFYELVTEEGPPPRYPDSRVDQKVRREGWTDSLDTQTNL